MATLITPLLEIILRDAEFTYCHRHNKFNARRAAILTALNNRFSARKRRGYSRLSMRTLNENYCFVS